VASHLVFVFSRPAAGREAEWNQWYGQHLRDVAALPGVTRARRYTRVARSSGEPAPPSAYLAVYEFEGTPAEFDAATAEAARAGKLPVSSAHAPGSIVWWFEEA
jgi:hypothetical protein